LCFFSSTYFLSELTENEALYLAQSSDNLFFIDFFFYFEKKNLWALLKHAVHKKNFILERSNNFFYFEKETIWTLLKHAVHKKKT